MRENNISQERNYNLNISSYEDIINILQLLNNKLTEWEHDKYEKEHWKKTLEPATIAKKHIEQAIKTLSIPKKLEIDDIILYNFVGHYERYHEYGEAAALIYKNLLPVTTTDTILAKVVETFSNNRPNFSHHSYCYCFHLALTTQNIEEYEKTHFDLPIEILDWLEGKSTEPISKIALKLAGKEFYPTIKVRHLDNKLAEGRSMKEKRYRQQPEE